MKSVITKKRIVISAALCLLASAHASAKEILVAQVAAFTGAQASSGKAIRAGINLYLNHVNRNGGVAGDRIRLVTYDDGYKAEETVRLVKEVLAKEAPLAFIGVLGTANNEAIIKDGILARANVPLVGAISGASTMLGAPNIYVTKASYGDEVRRLFEILSLIGMNRVAIVYQDDGFGKDIVTGAERAAPVTRVNLVVKAPYERNTTNVKPAVDAVLKSDAQVIYLGAVTSAAVEFIKQYRKGGGTAQIYGVSVIDINGMKKGLSPEELSGYGFGVLWPLTTSRTLPMTREYQQLAKEAKDPDLAERSMEGYIAAKVLVQGLRQTRSSPAALSKVVGGMKGVDIGGFLIDFTRPKQTGSQYVDFAIVNKSGSILQ
jgi:ABC-type branched-subunit amino acid transport system substrate-binding protein